MRLSKLYIKGFRNFKEETINFKEHTLIIGANDVGKTNLIYAIRILLDRGFSDLDYELKESDIFAYDDVNEIVIRLYLDEVTEDCVIARMPSYISDEGNLVLQYTASFENGSCEYKFFCGKSDKEDDLKVIDAPFYRKYLNIKYISSRRDFHGYINRTKSALLSQSKSERSEDAKRDDIELYADIKQYLNAVDEKIPCLSYVKNATDKLNEELNKLSIHNNEMRIVFDTASSDVDKLINNVNITSKFQDKNLIVGGEGRLNQIYLSLWTSQNLQTEESTEVSIICIEEPEAYLHPHQQRELASYLEKSLRGQVILTTHSPYIVSEFTPNSIIRLYKRKEHDTKAASNGCSNIIAKDFDDFGYRMSVIPAEAFFSDCVILVEGPSEIILYKTLAKQININLDRLNISVLDVEGVGFSTYVKILDALKIEWIARTDNDIMKIPHHDTYRYAGIERGLDLLDQAYGINKENNQIIKQSKSKIHGFTDKNNISQEIQDAAKELIILLDQYNILIAKQGLEEDLYNSVLQNDLKSFYGGLLTDEEILKAMKKHKAINMYDFIKQKKIY